MIQSALGLCSKPKEKTFWGGRKHLQMGGRGGNPRNKKDGHQEEEEKGVGKARLKGITTAGGGRKDSTPN